MGPSAEKSRGWSRAQIRPRLERESEVEFEIDISPSDRYHFQMEFPVNEELIETTAKLLEERRVAKERLDKIQSSQGDVSPAVFERVSKDYQDKFNSLTEQLWAKKGEIDKELGKLYETKTKLGENVETHKEQVEEVKFRQTLGEFDSDEAYETELGAANEKLTKFETLLKSVQTNIERYETLFTNEPDLRAAPGTAKPAEAPAAAPAPKPETPSSEVPLGEALHDVEYDDSGSGYKLESEEGDYYGESKPSAGATCVFSPQEIDPDTLVGPPPTAVEGSVLKVIQGDTDAAEFPLQEKTTLGRSNTCTIPLKDAKISRQHAMLKHNGTHWVVADLQSANGLLVNGRKVDTAKLRDGDRIQLGGFVLELKVS